MKRLWGALLALAVLAVIACSADSPCALGGRGWCENGLAAAAVKSVVGNGMDGMFANMVLVVEDGFTIDTDRYSVRNVAGLHPDQVQILTAPTVPANLVTLVISDVKITDSPGPGRVSAQGTAIMTVYYGSAVRDRTTVRGQLTGGTWVIIERKAAE